MEGEEAQPCILEGGEIVEGAVHDFALAAGNRFVHRHDDVVVDLACRGMEMPHGCLTDERVGWRVAHFPRRVLHPDDRRVGFGGQVHQRKGRIDAGVGSFVGRPNDHLSRSICDWADRSPAVLECISERGPRKRD